MEKTSFKAWLICSMGMIFYAYEFLLRIAPSVMEPQLREFFNISATGFGSLVSIYYLVYTPLQIVVGPLLDLFGPRLMLTIATAVCALGTLIFASTHSLALAGFGRSCIGFGSAFAFVGAMKLAATWLPPHRFATFTGLITALGMVGGMVGDVGLTPVVEHLGWQTTLFLGGIVGIILLPAMGLIIRNHPNHSETTHAKANHHSEIIKELARIVRNPQIWLSGIIACVLWLSLSAFAEVWGIPYLRTRGFSADQAALANSMVFFGWLVGSPALGAISDHLRKRRSIIFIGSIMAVASSLAIFYLPITSLYIILVLLFLFGFFCSVEVICFAVAYQNVSHRIAATTIAFVNMLTMAGGFIFQPLVGKLLDTAWTGNLHDGIRIYSIQNYHFALMVLPVAMTLGALLSLFIKENDHHRPLQVVHQ